MDRDDTRLDRFLRAQARIVLWAFSPLIVLMLVLWLGGIAGCTFEALHPVPCRVLGRDVGDSLHAHLDLRYLAFVTVPLGAIASLLYAVWSAEPLLKRVTERFAAAGTAAGGRTPPTRSSRGLDSDWRGRKR